MSDETALGESLDTDGNQGQEPSATQERSALQSSLAALNQTLQGLLANTEKMASKEYVEGWQREQERKRSRFVAMVVSVGVCFLLIFALMGFTLAKVYDFTDTSNQNTKVVLDCTQPVDENGNPNQCYTQRRAIQEQSQREESQKIIDKVTHDIIAQVTRNVTRNIIKWAEKQMAAAQNSQR